MEIRLLLLLSILVSSCSTLKTNKAIFVTRSMERNIKFNDNIFDYLEFDNAGLENSLERKCVSGSFSGEVQKMIELIKAKSTPLVQVEIGVCYQLAGEFSKALYYYDQGLAKIKPKQKTLKSLVFNNLGIMFGKRDQFDKAYNYLEKSLLERPNYFITVYNMALTLTSIGRYDESISLIKKFRGNSEEEKELTKILGIDYLSMNDMSSLESKVINRLDDKLSEKAFLHAVVKYYKTGDSKVAYELLEDIDDLNPIYQQLYNELIGILKQKIRDDERKKVSIDISKSGRKQKS